MPDVPTTRLPHAQHRDSKTGALIHQLSTDNGINHSFFFLNSSFRPQHPTQLAYVAHGTGQPQLMLFDFSTTMSVCLTAVQGMQPFSPAWSPDGSTLYYTTRSGDIEALHVEKGVTTRLAHFDAGIGECGVSHDGAHIVTAYKQEKRHGLIVVNTTDGSGGRIHESDMKIIHPQFHRNDARCIVYAGDPAPRLWTIQRDGRQNQCLYENTAREFIVHESFLGRSDELIFAIWPYRLCRMNIYERVMTTIVELNAWHMSATPDGSRIVTDTNHPDRGLLLIDPNTGSSRPLCYPQSSCSGSQWKKDHPAGADVWAAIRGQDGESLSWMEMQVDHVYGPQWTHPHPAFDHAGQRVVYTSDVTGHPQVYVVELPPGE
ncbi:MAG: hypothetical protein O3A51_07405 [Verrucomicrobia bacterium]|nr:hypothetical protein [Verrucomicrobiota bacterium]